MKITDWNSLNDWVKSIGPANAELSVDYILSIPKKEQESWRRRVMKFSPVCHFSGIVSSYEPEPRGGLMLFVTTKQFQNFTLLISSEKKELLSDVIPMLNSKRSLVISFTPYIHYQHGYIGVVKECNLCAEQVHNAINVKSKIMPKSAINTASTWNNEKDRELLDCLDKDLGIRVIAQQLNISPIRLLGHMHRLNVINVEQHLEMKEKLGELGFS